MEHFDEDQIPTDPCRIPPDTQTRRRLVLFWPPVYGLSVIALKVIHFVLNHVLRRNVQLHRQSQARYGLEDRFKNSWTNPTLI